ncbi:MAG: tRNA glutamyl-Q(34) synthetase GluQRS [Burkholderiales bacterium]
MTYRGRFAPTPSGPLHFGSMVAAIASWCDARAHGGVWQLRIDDLDPPRTAPGAIDSILRCLEAFALEWDGEVVYQSRRSDAYHVALHRLREAMRVFACGCSRREIFEVAGDVAGTSVYPGTCRNGLPPGRAARAQRLRVEDVAVGFDDLLQGRIEQQLATRVGDFVLYRAEHVYSYHLACVVDDAEEGVTCVVRGADLIDSTPRQIYLQRLLGLPTPQYLHLPIAVDPSGQKLSKQTLAHPVDPANAAPVIHAVLRFLGQRPAPELGRAAPSDALRWAMSNWSRKQLPAAHSITL